jgi:hypothetical protein
LESSIARWLERGVCNAGTIGRGARYFSPLQTGMITEMRGWLMVGGSFQEMVDSLFSGG